MGARGFGVAAVLVVASLGGRAEALESPCARSIRDVFDRAGQLANRSLDAKAQADIEERVRAHPERCAPGDYALFANRYADLLTVLGASKLTDAERKLAYSVRPLAPRRVASTGYEAAFHAFLDARSRLAAHAAPEVSTELLALFDAVRPVEILPSVALGRDRAGVLQGLNEVRRLLATGQVKDADARVEELIRALQADVAVPTKPDATVAPAPDGGSPDAGTH